ncbi:MAG: hypothetical protein ACFFFG_09735 [Candidatus Thorarchaeota archaeon]
MAQFRTFGWIARQNPHVRVTEDVVSNDSGYKFPQLSDKVPQLNIPLEERKKWFKRGSLWPTMILVEKRYGEANSQRIERAYVRVYRQSDGAILDVLVGDSLDLATLLAVEFGVPLFSVTCSRKGMRGVAQRIPIELE